jgi:AraC family transcriptional regulator
MNSAVERAIACMWERYSEPLSLADLAQSAILSRFHFSRVFRENTGVSPGRFLSALRIYQAKRMLATTSLSVTDISLAVGYNSLGSFTNRFTESVGVSPARFRQMSMNGGYKLPERVPDSYQWCGAVAGSVRMPSGYAAARVFLGVFKTPIVQGRPASSAVIETEPTDPSAPYMLAGIPQGDWFVMAVAVADSADPEPWTRRSMLVSQPGAVTVGAESVTELEIRLRARRPTDLPILLALPDLETDADIDTETDTMFPQLAREEAEPAEHAEAALRSASRRTS